MPPGTEPAKITAETAWSQLTHTLGRKMPARLTASGKARQGLVALMRGKGR